MFLLSQAFAQYAPEGKDPKAFTTLFLQKTGFLMLHLVGLAIGLWKCQQMGLLPTGTGDWLAFETRGPVRLLLLQVLGLLSSHTRHRRSHCFHDLYILFDTLVFCSTFLRLRVLYDLLHIWMCRVVRAISGRVPPKCPEMVTGENR